MHRSLVFLSIFFLSLAFGLAQEEKKKDSLELDSLKNDLNQKGIVIDATVEKKRINPLAPSKAAFYSAVLPGLGQAYNKRYWKIPIVYAAIGTGVYAYTYNNDNYNTFRNIFKRRRAGFTDDELYDRNGDGVGPDFSDAALQDAQERFQRDRDLALVITIALYALNIIDANVDAHLKQFNVDDDLGLDLDIKPYLEYNPVTANPNYGMALIVKF